MAQLHPQIRDVLKVMTEAGLRPIEEMTPAEAREQMEATARARKAEPLRIAKIEERLVPRPGGAIRLRSTGRFNRRRQCLPSSIFIAAATSSGVSIRTIL